MGDVMRELVGDPYADTYDVDAYPALLSQARQVLAALEAGIVDNPPPWAGPDFLEQEKASVRRQVADLEAKIASGITTLTQDMARQRENLDQVNAASAVRVLRVEPRYCSITSGWLGWYREPAGTFPSLELSLPAVQEQAYWLDCCYGEGHVEVERLCDGVVVHTLTVADWHKANYHPGI